MWRRSLFLLATSLLHGQQFDGTVVNALTGDPLPNMRVRLSGARSQTYTITDNGGCFHFTPPTDGMFTVEVDRPGLNPARRSVYLTDDPATIQIPVTLGGIITGTVTDPNGLPPEFPQAHVQLYTRRTWPGDSQGRLILVATMLVDDRGQYRTAPLEPGDYYIGALLDSGTGFSDRTWHTVYYPSASDMDSAAPIQLASGQEFRADLQYLRVAGVRVSGNLQIVPPAPQDAPVRIELRRVSSIRESPSPSVVARGADYRIDHIPPGEYTVTAFVQDPAFIGYKAIFGDYHRLTVGQQDAHLDLRLQAIPDLKGTVTFIGDCAPTPVRVLFNFIETVTAADGSFVLSGMSPGPGGIRVAPVSEESGASAVSILLGGREVLHQALDFPFSATDVRITMKCGTGGAQ